MVWNVRPGFPSWLSNSSTSLLCVSLIALYSKLDLKLMKPNIHSIDLLGDVRNAFMYSYNLKNNLWFDHLSSLLWFVLLNCLVELMFADNLSTQTAHGRVHCLLSQICWVSQVLLCCETKFLGTITHSQPEGDGDGIKYSSQKYNHWNHTSKLPSPACRVTCKNPSLFHVLRVWFWLKLTAWQENNEADIEWEPECSEGVADPLNIKMWNWLPESPWMFRIDYSNCANLTGAALIMHLVWGRWQAALRCAVWGCSERPFPHEWDSRDYNYCYPLRVSCTVA